MQIGVLGILVIIIVLVVILLMYDRGEKKKKETTDVDPAIKKNIQALAKTINQNQSALQSR